MQYLGLVRRWLGSVSKKNLGIQFCACFQAEENLFLSELSLCSRQSSERFLIPCSGSCHRRFHRLRRRSNSSESGSEWYGGIHRRRRRSSKVVIAAVVVEVDVVAVCCAGHRRRHLLKVV